MFGKMSTGMRSAASVPPMKISRPITTNVEGRLKASLTIASIWVGSHVNGELDAQPIGSQARLAQPNINANSSKLAVLGAARHRPVAFIICSG
jgi:hypothetical protein